MAIRLSNQIQARGRSPIRHDDHVMDAVFSRRIDRVPCELQDNASAQATGASGNLTVAIQTANACLLTFDGHIEELPASTGITLFPTDTTILPNVNDGVAWAVAARLSADRESVDLVAVQGEVATNPDAPEDSLSAGVLASLQALCPSEHHCLVLGTVLVKRTADTVLTLSFEHAFQLAQFFKATPTHTGDDYMALLDPAS